MNDTEALKQISAGLAARYPDFMKRIYPREYTAYTGYPSPRFLSVAAFDSILKSQTKFQIPGSNEIDHTAINIYGTPGRLVQCGVPTFFVSRQLLTALSQTQLPPNLRLSDIRWPFNAILFVLPSNALVSPDGEALFIVVAKHGVEEECRIDPALSQIHSFFHEPAISSCCIVSQAYTYAWAHGLNQDAVNAGSKDPYAPCYALDLEGTGPLIVRKDLTDADKTFSNLQRTLTLQLLLGMISRPELIEPERMLHAGTVKHIVKGGRIVGKVQERPPTWHPNILGRHYQIQEGVTHTPGTHASPRMHWRRGHFRVYVKGEHWKEDETIWIEPMLVNA